MSTKSTRSSGTQITKKGINQGVVLVDPVTGNPINVVFEGGQYKLVVKGDGSSGGGGPTSDVNIISSIPIGIKDQTTGNIFKINPDGSIDANVEVDAADGDSIMIVGTEDGNPTGTQHTAKIGADRNLRVRDDDANTKLQSIADNTDQVEAKLDALNAELAQKTEPADAQNIRAINALSDSIAVPGVATEAKQDTSNTTLANILIETTSIATSVDQVEPKLDAILTELTQKTEPADAQNIRPLVAATDAVSVPGVATSANQVITNATLASIDSKLTNPIPIVGNVSIGDLDATKDDVAVAGTENGTATGTIRHFVNNRRQQILSSHDRQQVLTYADFGTKDQRTTSITYTSPTFPGISAVKTITYTLVGNKYRRDDITWSII